MFLVDLISWWYFRGWGIYFDDLRKKLGDTADMFSIGEMVRTLFKPYKQISAGADSAIDRLISRFVGFFARLVIILAGLILLAVEVILGLLLAIIWPVVPLMPIVGIILMVVGVTF